jgi:CheY-like chemotaxis protein
MQLILVADDDMEVRNLLHEMLILEYDWAVTTVPDGPALLETAGKIAPDLVLLDVRMPGIDGLETYRLLREDAVTRDIPVLFVTVDVPRIRQATLPGRYRYLAKPFKLDELLEQVTALLEESKWPN